MKRFLSGIVILVILLSMGCSKLPADSTSTLDPEGEREELTGADQAEAEKGPISLAGIQLGADSVEVVEKLGSNYQEEKFEDSGFFGEGFAIWQYEGIDVVIGLESHKVLQLEAYAPQFATQAGDKVGDEAKAVLEKYRAKYQEYEGVNSDGPLTGWFKVDEDTLLIFSFNKDRSRFNQAVSDDSKVEAITLGYTYYFD